MQKRKEDAVYRARKQESETSALDELLLGVAAVDHLHQLTTLGNLLLSSSSSSVYLVSHSKDICRIGASFWNSHLCNCWYVFSSGSYACKEGKET